MKSGLGPSRVIEAAHQWLQPVLEPGSLAVDLTAGNGHDTLFLARLVGARGSVLAFDIQQQALDHTEVRLLQAGLTVRKKGSWRRPVTGPGVVLVHDDHQYFSEYLSAPPVAIIGNLGYLPGGDKQIITRAQTTSRALESALHALCLFGRIAVVVYQGHPGAAPEVEAVKALFAGLPANQWKVERQESQSSSFGPILFAVEKLGVE